MQSKSTSAAVHGSRARAVKSGNCGGLGDTRYAGMSEYRLVCPQPDIKK
jgi:hypothetical protein